MIFKITYIDLFIKILMLFEEEFVERQENKGGEQLEINNRVKDGIR